MKMMIFVSTGRCGTTRLAEILREVLPSEKFSIEHQVEGARWKNLVGNLMYHFGNSEKKKEKLFESLLKGYARNEYFISTDPLTAMIIPKRYIDSKDVYIIHLEREANSFAKSIYRLSRKKRPSFIAHNFIPLWQPYLWPLENLLSPSILKKYSFIAQMKGDFFRENYSSNPHFRTIRYEDLFKEEIVANLIREAFGTEVVISKELLTQKSN